MRKVVLLSARRSFTRTSGGDWIVDVICERVITAAEKMRRKLSTALIPFMARTTSVPSHAVCLTDSGNERNVWINLAVVLMGTKAAFLFGVIGVICGQSIRSPRR